MDIDEIMKRFAALAGLTEEDAAVWQPLCEDALVRIQSQCREDVDTAEQSGLLCAAVSALAFYQYSLRSTVTETEDFTAGDIRITQKTSSNNGAKELWEDAKEQIAPLLKSPLFYFGATKRGWGHEA